jgi:hypothetical protein
VQELGDRRFGGAPDSRVALPTTTRAADKEAAAHLVDAPGLVGLVHEAEARYRALARAAPS